MNVNLLGGVGGAMLEVACGMVVATRGAVKAGQGLALLMVGAVGLTGCSANAFESEDLVGTWKSASCEVGTGADGSAFYYTREFKLTGSDWTIDFTLFGDEACGYKLSTATIAGPYELLEAVEGLEGTRQGNFSGESKSLVAYDQGMADYFTASGCGTAAWTVGASQDVGATGCAPLGLDAIDDCPTEFDIVKLDGDNLFFGDRSHGMCDEANRTSSLQTVPVVRQ